MEDESSVTRRIIGQIHSSDIEVDQTEAESGVNQTIIAELPSSDIERDQMEC